MSTLDEHARSGLEAIEQKRYDDAIASFRAAIAADVASGQEGRPDIRHALAMAHLHRGDVGNAVEPLEEAVRLSERFAEAQHQTLRREFHLTLATVYQLVDRVGASRKVLETVIARWPEAVEPYLQLGQLLLSSCNPEEGCKVYARATDLLDKDQRESAKALVGAVRAFLESGNDASGFLEAHGDSYRQYFDEIARAQLEQGWYAEAARMTRRPDGEIVPVLGEGAKPYALERVDLVNPADGSVSSVYSEQEPMIVQVEGLEPLAQVPITLPWAGWPFEVWVSTRCPWHWLSIVVQLREAMDEQSRVEAIEPAISTWYLAGYNGEFGDKETGRFHYVTDPDMVGTRAITYVVDLGRAKFDAIPDLLRKLVIAHDRTPIQRVLFGEGRLPEDL
jgi:tetratricopeptide (TPR) repeat protein